MGAESRDGHAAGRLHTGRLRHAPDAVAICWALESKRIWKAVVCTLPSWLLSLVPFAEGLSERLYPYRYLVDTGRELALVLPADIREWHTFNEPVERVRASVVGRARFGISRVRCGEIELLMRTACAVALCERTARA